MARRKAGIALPEATVAEYRILRPQSPAFRTRRARERWGESMTIYVGLRGIVRAASTDMATMAEPQAQSHSCLSADMIGCMLGLEFGGIETSPIVADAGGKGLMR
jgi:hypothetical protein